MRKVIIGLSIVAISLMAVDYSQMTMEEMNALRGTVAVEERSDNFIRLPIGDILKILLIILFSHLL